VPSVGVLFYTGTVGRRRQRETLNAFLDSGYSRTARRRVTQGYHIFRITNIRRLCIVTQIDIITSIGIVAIRSH